MDSSRDCCGGHVEGACGFGLSIRGGFLHHGSWTSHCRAGHRGRARATEITTKVHSASTPHSSLRRYPLYGPLTLLGVFPDILLWHPVIMGWSYVLLYVCVLINLLHLWFLRFHFIEVTLAFEVLFDSMDRVGSKKIYSPMHLENITSYLA